MWMRPNSEYRLTTASASCSTKAPSIGSEEASYRRGEN
jgi:hypothetical protein